MELTIPLLLPVPSLGDINAGKHFVLIKEGYIGTDGNPHNYPISYGVHLRYNSYYAFHLLISNDGGRLFISGTASNVTYPTAWHEVTMNT